MVNIGVNVAIPWERRKLLKAKTRVNVVNMVNVVEYPCRENGGFRIHRQFGTLIFIF